MPLTIKPSSGSGSVTIQATTGTTTNDTLTLPAKTGNIITSADSGTVTQTMLGTNVAGNGPAFSAYNTGNQALSASTWTKITLPSEEFDTNNNFDSTTNYRFTPTIAGYYQFACCFNISAASGIVLVSLYKNGSEFKRLQQISMNSGANIQPNGGAIIYLNGSTDYVEMYGYQNSAGSVNTAGGQSQVYFQGALVRAA